MTDDEQQPDQPDAAPANRHAVRVLYLELDGTVQKGFDELGRFVNGPDDVELFPGMARLLAAYKGEGWRIVGVSNQGGVALGHLTSRQAMAAVEETQRQASGAFDLIMFCEHHPDATDPAQARCFCRKPKIGLHVMAAANLSRIFQEDHPPHLALLVDDRDEDRQCATNAGVDFLDAATWRALGKPISAVEQKEVC